MAIFTMLIVGLFVGAIARVLMPGRDPGGILVTIAIGIGGGVGAGLVARELGWYGDGQSAGIIASIVGSVILLALYRVLVANRAIRRGA
jgi:uncharacterized membrane protein YeaQ/YmgE (transglycosylase-associated protein family)